MPLSIEMTVRGVLLAGHWRTEKQLDQMTTDDKRNTLIVALTTITNQSAHYFQGFNDDTLVGKAAVTVFLLEAGLVDIAWFKVRTDDAARNNLIVQLNMKTDRSIPELQGKTNKELVVLGLEWFNKSKLITGIVNFSWKPDNAKIIATVPDMIAQQTYLNSSNNESQDKFRLEKDIANKSTFSREHGFTVKIGVETEFEEGIPYIADNKTTVSIEAGTTNKWRFGEENSTIQKYTYEADVKLPPHSKIKRTATITRSSMNVPYTATVLTGDGSKRDIEGTWNGVSTYDLIVTQDSFNTVSLEVQRETLETVEVNPKQSPAQ